MSKTRTPKELVGFQYTTIFENHYDEIQELIKGEGNHDFIWILLKVFSYGWIVGIRDERARRKRKHTK